MGAVCSTEGYNNNNPNFGKRSVGSKPLGRHKVESKNKAIPAAGRGCEMSRMPHLLDNRLTDGGEVVSIMRWPRPTPQKHFLVLISVQG
jgi:hypothetical protein